MPLTEAHKIKLARGREAAIIDRQRIEDAQVIDWRRWLREDARRFALLRAAEAGGDPADIREARAAWVTNLHHEPKRPPDSAFKRARGEAAEPEA